MELTKACRGVQQVLRSKLLETSVTCPPVRAWPQRSDKLKDIVRYVFKSARVAAHLQEGDAGRQKSAVDALQLVVGHIQEEQPRQVLHSAQLQQRGSQNEDQDAHLPCGVLCAIRWSLCPAADR